MAYRRKRSTRRRARKYRKARVYKMKSGGAGAGRTRTRTRTRTRINRRWKNYSFTRMTDIEFKNIDPTTGSPQMQVSTSYSPLAVIPNQLTPLVQDTTAPSADYCTNFSSAMIFKLANLQNMAEFINTSSPPAGLFEEYKITGVRLEFNPVYGGKDLVKSTYSPSLVGVDDFKTLNWSYPTPTMYYMLDHDNTNSINWPMICETAGVQKVKLNRPFNIMLRPKPVMPIAQSLTGASVFSGTYKKAPWVTNKNLNIEHYGFRFLIQDWPGPSDDTGTTAPPTEADHVSFALRVNIRYYFKVRGVR